ncbi:hypothetical protein F5877DRAFT_34317 [Lentinula edodes]|nr:hypothetical protein F5877DRAFT_34317 [Lentinula edodes]
MPFTVKATYRSETRKLSFPECDSFPSFDQLYHQLYRVFPISHSIVLSKLLFSPDSSDSRVLLSREVRNAAEYDLAVAPFKGRAWMGPSLRVSVSDETPHKLPSSPHTWQPQASNPQKPVVSNPFPVVEPSFGRISYSHIPPPPIIFSSRPCPQEPMDVGKPETNDPPTVPQHDIASCCAVAQTRKDVQELITSFKVDLDRVIASLEPSPQNDIPMPLNQVPHSEDSIQLPKIPLQYNLCWRCGVIKQGPWFDCSTCNNKLCVTCLETTSISDCFFGSPHVWKKQTCSYCAPNSTPTPTPSPLQPASWGSNGRVVHHGVSCDSCRSIIEGVRHKCLDCPDYDLCSSCIANGAAARHTPFHEFFEISEPGRVVVHNVFSGSGEREAAPPMRHNGSPVQSSQPVVHNAVCDLCESRIRGDRYKCINCPDWDCCGESFVTINCNIVCLFNLLANCFTITNEHHPRHAFVKVSRPEDFIRRDQTPVKEHFATCDSCSRRIFGIRYKCMHQDCPDFDLCSACEALPIAVHPATHPLLKVKDVGTALPTVHRNNVGEFRPPANDIATSASDRSPIEAAPASLRAPSPTGSYGSGCSRNPAAGTHGIPSPEAQPPSPFYFRSQSARSQTPESEVENTSLPAPAPVRNFSPSSIVGEREPLLSRPASSNSLSESERSVRSLASILSGIKMPATNPFITAMESKEALIGTPSAPVPPVVSLPSTPSTLNTLNAEFVADRNIVDGQVVAPGAEFLKAWVMRNGGSRPWPEGTELVFVAGESFAKDNTSIQPQSVGVVQPNEQIELWTGELKAPENPGRYVAYYRLRDGEGNLFGHSIWLDITVSEAFQRDSPETLASSDYLSSSSIIIMPTAASTPSSAVANNDANGNGAPEGLHRNSLIPGSPVTALSAPSVSDYVETSDNDSETSGSLLDVTDSDSDEELWQDSRTSVLVEGHGAESQATIRATTLPDEYVVLYDEATSSEEE